MVVSLDCGDGSGATQLQKWLWENLFFGKVSWATTMNQIDSGKA